MDCFIFFKKITINASRWPAGSNVAEQNKEFVILMRQQFLCGEPGLLSRAEPSQVVLNTEGV